MECGIRALWPWNIGSLGDAKNSAIAIHERIHQPRCNFLQWSRLWRKYSSEAPGDFWRWFSEKTDGPRPMEGGWEAVVGKRVGLSVSQVFKTWCRFRIKSTSECPRWLYTFHHLWNSFHLANTSQAAEKKFRDTGRAGTAKNSRSARKVEAMSCSVTHASPVKARTSTRQEKCGSTVGYS